MSKPSLDFTLVNNYSDAEGKAIIYITPDENKNLLKLKVENDGDETATFESNVVGIELLLANVLPDDIIPNIIIGCPSNNWTATYSSSNKAWQLKPSQEISLSSGKILEFSLSKVAFPETVQPSTKPLKLTYKINEESRSKQKSLPVQLCELPNTPGLPFLNYSVGCEFQKLDDWNISDDGTQLLVPEKADDVVYINETNDFIIKTRLKFYLANEVAEAIAKGSNTKLQLSFQGGDDARDLASIGDGLTDNTDLADIELKFVSSSANNRWEITKSTAGGVPMWTLSPQGSNVLNKDETVYFVLEDIKGNSIAGVSKMYLSYFDIPKYKDGYLVTPIEKEQPYTQIIDFSVNNSNPLASDPVTVNYQVFGASKLELFADKGNPLPTSPIELDLLKTQYILKYPNHPHFEDEQETTVTYTLKSYPRNGGDPITRDLKIKVSSLHDKLKSCLKPGSYFELVDIYYAHSQTGGLGFGCYRFKHQIEFVSVVEPVVIIHTLEKGFLEGGTSGPYKFLARGNRSYNQLRITKDTQAGESSATFKLVYAIDGEDAHKYEIQYDPESQRILLKVSSYSGELFRSRASGFDLNNSEGEECYIDTRHPSEYYRFEDKKGELKNDNEQ
ncbi:hypothetical protein NIES4073_19100 [Kalymmatonema gypsitolerans NIES-4073]|nr:hypothetical protein NIES4073_19100 [Scytonema sp. NIES-4073]